MLYISGVVVWYIRYVLCCFTTLFFCLLTTSIMRAVFVNLLTCSSRGCWTWSRTQQKACRGVRTSSRRTETLAWRTACQTSWEARETAASSSPPPYRSTPSRSTMSWWAWSSTAARPTQDITTPTSKTEGKFNLT